MFDFITKAFSKKASSGNSMNGDLSYLYKIIGGNTDQTIYSAQELLKLNNGWVYACNNKIAMSLATVPLHLYYNNKGSKSLEFTPHRKLLKNEIEKIKDTSPNHEIKQAKEIVEIEKHQVLDLLKKINKNQNYTDFTYLLGSYLGLIGNVYILIVRDEKSTLPLELHILQSENVSVLIDDNGLITGYKYTRKVNTIEKTVIFKPEEIIHIKNLVPGASYYGKGELESCLAPVQRYNYYDVFEAYLNKNYSRPDFIVSYKGKFTEKELRDAQKQWFKQFGDPKNAGKPLITSELDINTLGYSPKDMSFPQGREWCKREICSVFGVPESLLTLNDANYASAKSASDHFYRYTICPKLRLLCEKYNEQLLPLYDNGLFLWYSDTDFIEPENMSYQDVLSAQAQGILSVEEARSVFGFEAKKEE